MTGGLHLGNRDRKRGSLPGRTFARNGAVQLLRHDVVHNVQAQPGSVLGPFCGEKRLKNLGEMLVSDALAIVPINHGEGRVGERHVNRDRALSPLVKPMHQGIHDQMVEDLCKRARITGQFKLLRTGNRDRMSKFLELRPEAQHDVLQVPLQEKSPRFFGGQIDRHVFKTLNQMGRAGQIALDDSGGLGRDVDIPVKFGPGERVCGIVLRHFPGAEFKVGGGRHAVANRGINFMRDAGDQRANGGHFLGFDELFLGLL